MSKYPLDNQAVEELARDILAHHRGQLDTIERLRTLLNLALMDGDPDDNDWFEDAEKLVKVLNNRSVEFENLRFNQRNGHSVGLKSPFPPVGDEVPGRPIDIKMESQLNAMEAQEFGDELSEAELATMFRQDQPRKKKKKIKKLSKMSLEEIEAWEKAQENSNDIYKVSARVKNLARSAVKANLTAQGDMVVNMFTHVIKAFYDFADTVDDKEIKIKLTELVRRQEGVPADLIAALGAGVKNQ